MTLSTFSTLLGLTEFLVGIPMMLNPGKTMAVMKNMLDQDSLMRIMGSLLLLIGGLVLFEGYEIRWTLPGFLRLMAWMTTIKGILFCWFPKLLRPIHRWAFSAKHIHPLWGILACIGGVFFLWAGSTLG